MSAKRRPSMNDVARVAGVSQTAVSLVLNNPEGSGIPLATQERIHNAVQEVGYRTNRLARAMRLDRSDTLGLVSENIATTPYASEMIRGAQDAAWEAGRLLLIFDTGSIDGPDHTKREQTAVNEFLERQVDGIIVASMFHRHIALPNGLDEVASILLNATCDDAAFTSVVPDDYDAAYDATRHLIDNGHTNIACHSIEVPESAAAPLRLQGFRDAMADHGLPVAPESVVIEPATTLGGRTAARRLLDLDDPPTAVFVFNDQTAMGAFQYAADAGMRIPDDLSVVGFDNQSLIAEELLPGLTTMALPHYAMGHWAVTRILSPEISQPTRHMIACPLIERGSVAQVSATS